MDGDALETYMKLKFCRNVTTTERATILEIEMKRLQ
jgi:hypothetical protein